MTPVHRNTVVWSCIATLTAIGTIGMAPVLLRLWDIWTDDPLKSLGMLIVPVSVLLTLRVWRQAGWELRGSWWGLLPVALGLCMSGFEHRVDWRLLLGPVNIDFLSLRGALYLFGSGVVLLFAGVRVWRKAWFPLALLLCAQPAPHIFVAHADLPLQDISAHIARSFAVMIGYPPTSQELLRLMFTPNFGMFIAPGCDGIRGALTMGYLAMIVGYLKKVSPLRWIAYVLGGVLLGYTFNLIRLCALVLYYRVATGHPGLENFAKWADYIIGGCLFLVAALLFLWTVTRKEVEDTGVAETSRSIALTIREQGLFFWRAAVFAVLALPFAVPALHAIRSYRKSFAAEVRDREITPPQLDALLPKQLGAYTLSRAWQQVDSGRIVIENGAYSGTAPDEAILGVWLPSHAHSVLGSWMAHGQDLLQHRALTFETARGSIRFDTAFSTDGITDMFAGNAECTPTDCVASTASSSRGLTFKVNLPDFETRGKRIVSIYFEVDRPHASGDPVIARQQLILEAQQFVNGVDFNEISRIFQ